MSKENDLKLNVLSPSDIKPASLDIAAVRTKLAGATWPRYWRTLEELANEKDFGELAGTGVSAPGLGVVNSISRAWLV